MNLFLAIDSLFFFFLRALVVRGGGFEPEKFEKNLKEIPLQMTMKIQQCRWGREGGAELVPQYVFQRLYFTCQRKRFTHPGISVFPHFRRISRHDI